MFKGMNYVYEVYKSGSLKKAADRLLISPSSLSASIKRVEDKIGYPVFDRSTRPIKLTECGEQYIRAVEEIIGVQEHFEAYVNDLGGLRAGSLRIGGPSVAASIMLPPIISEYHRLFPSVHTEITEGTSIDLAQMLIDGEFDIVMDYGAVDSEFIDSRHIQDDYLILSVPVGREINRVVEEYRISHEDIRSGRFKNRSVKPVPFEVFRDEPFVLIKPRNNSRILADRFFERYDIHPRVAFEASQQMSAYFTMTAGIGSAFVSSTLLSDITEDHACCCYKLDPDIAQRHLCLLWKKGRYITKAMEEFILLAERMCK